MRRSVLILATVAAGALAVPATGAAKVVTLTAKMKGSKEVPGPGDANGSGKAVIRLNAAKGKVCAVLTVNKIGEATAAHIHQGDAGVAGNVVVSLLATPTSAKTIKRCATGVASDLIKSILKHPGRFYVNVHTADFQGGAIRGQLRHES